MKKIITLIAAALALCCMAQAQSSNLQNNDMGNNGGSGTLTYSWTAPTGTTSMAVCFEGDVITGGHDDITGVTYNSTSLTQVGKYAGADGSGHNNRFLYLYKLNSPSTGAAHNIVITSTNSHYLLGVVTAYGGSSDIAGNVNVDGPTATSSSPWTINTYTSQGGSMEMYCAEGGSQVAGLNTVVEVQGSAFAEPSIIDTGTWINPPDALSMTSSWSGKSGTHWDDIRIQAEVLPATTQFDVLQSAVYTSSNSWTFNASDSGMNSCDYEASAWDETTSPYTNITSSATFTCDSSYNIKAAFAGNQTGHIAVVPNPKKCGLLVAPCTGTPPTTTHGVIGPPKNPVKLDSTANGSSGQFSSTVQYTHTIGANCSNPYLIAAFNGNLAPSTQTVMTATYGSQSLTLLTTVNSAGSGTVGDPILWVYGVAPSSTGSHTITFTVNSGVLLHGASVSYCNVHDVVAGQTTPHNEMFGPFSSTSPQDEAVYPLEAGSVSLLISQTQAATADTTNTITTARISSGVVSIYDTKTFVNPGWHFPMGLNFTTGSVGPNLFFQAVHLRPAPPLYWTRMRSSTFPSGTTWTFNATDSGMQSCDYQGSVWDTTTNPYTDLTSLATFSCDGSNNITATFSANQTGQMIIVPNATTN